MLVGSALLLPATASAHAQLLSVEPADGARLDEAPAAVTLRFDEAVGLAAGGVSVLDGTGKDVAIAPPVVDGSEVRQPLSALSDGWYLVTWGVVSQDGHVVRGASTFAVGSVAGSVEPSETTFDPGAAVTGLMRGLTDLGTLVAAGAWFAWWLLGARTRHVLDLARVAVVLALVGTIGWATVGWLDGGSTWLGSVAALGAGARIVLLLVALPASERYPGLAASATLTALFTLVAGGHAVDPPMATLLEATHLLAAATWLGAAPAVLLVLRDQSLDDQLSVMVVRRFSALAAVVLFVVGGAGVLLAWVLTDGLAGGLTPYVLLLGAKILVVGIAAVTGALARLHLRGEPSRRTLRRVFALDSVLVILIVVVSAGLTLTGPREGQDPSSAGAGERCTAAVGQSSATIMVTPATAGEDRVSVSGLPPSTLGVGLELTHGRSSDAPIRVDASAADPDWQADLVLPLEGSWQITVAAHVDRFTEARGACAVTIGP
jgi:copper transport protein